MRVIAGSARSLPLKTLEGMDTRPTTDRIKETLFNMIQSEIPGCRFLDLYAGSGAIAIEALSRGAKEAVLVENSKAACACIRENLAFTKLDSQAVLMEQDVAAAIVRLSKCLILYIWIRHMQRIMSAGHWKRLLQAVSLTDIRRLL